MSAASNEEPRRYVVRLTERARLDMDRAYDRFRSTIGERLADEWQDGLLVALGTLALFPQRCSCIAEAERFSREVRQLLYRRPRSSSTSPAYRILFYTTDDSLDAPTVYVFHIRYAAAAPISAQEASEIDSEPT